MGQNAGNILSQILPLLMKDDEGLDFFKGITPEMYFPIQTLMSAKDPMTQINLLGAILKAIKAGTGTPNPNPSATTCGAKAAGFQHDCANDQTKANEFAARGWVNLGATSDCRFGCWKGPAIMTPPPGCDPTACLPPNRCENDQCVDQAGDPAIMARAADGSKRTSNLAGMIKDLFAKL